MPAERFYIDAELDGSLHLSGPELHHLHVMRSKVGNEVELVNGRGSLAKARIQSLSKKEAVLEVFDATHSPIREPRLNLGVPLMRPSKLEIVIEKCTELGADAFYLYPGEYSEKKELSAHQKERLQHIAISAMKQCGRLDLPPIHLVHSLRDLFELDIPIFFGDLRKNQKAPTKDKILFITGPEKGFSEKELQLLDSKGNGFSLSQNILRAETAPIAATCLLN